MQVDLKLHQIAPVKGLTPSEFANLAKNAASKSSLNRLRVDWKTAEELNMPGLAKVSHDAFILKLHEWSRQLSARLDALEK